MRGRKSLVLLLAVFFVLVAQPAAAQVANDYYASCVACHTLPIYQAQGIMSPHGWNPPPGSMDDACTMMCHEWTPPEGHFGPPANPFYWEGFLDLFSYPPGPSVTTQMCENCHDTTMPPLSAMHPNDQIPYLPSMTTPPPSVLPLFEGTGLPNQDPNMGGMTCSTCHDPHDPGFYIPSLGKPAFLRVGEPLGDYTSLCATCHTDAGPQTMGHDLFVDSKSTSVRFFPGPVAFMDIEVDVLNRGTAEYLGGNMDIFYDDGSGFAFFAGSAEVPYIPAEGTALVLASIPSFPLEGDEVFHFILEQSQMSPYRINTFVRAINVPPPPQNLTVAGTSNSSVDLQWQPPVGYPSTTPITYNVYRNGVKVNLWPLGEWETFFSDFGLAPDTPHTYTVAAANPQGFISSMSNRVGAMTDRFIELRVPQDYPTIDLALQAAGPGTTILVGPGTYSAPFTVFGSEIAIKGQDANGCILDLTVLGEADINGSGPNSLSGFTIINGRIVSGSDDTLSEIVFQSSPGVSVFGGGFITNSIFEQLIAPSIDVPYGEKITVANSIFRTGDPMLVPMPDEQAYLLNNSFPAWFDWSWWPGEGNFTFEPPYTPPGPPARYFTEYGPGHDTGADVGLPFQDFARDVGVFEIGVIYTPRPPTALDAQWVSPGFVGLSWQPSADEDIYFIGYEVFRSSFSDFPGLDDEIPYDVVQHGTYSYEDFGTIPGETYYYRVRAVSTVRSAPTDAVSIVVGGAAPVAADDNYITDEDIPIHEPAPGVLGNDTDDDGDPLAALLTSGPSFAQSFTLHPDGAFDYVPLADWSGTDSFTYFATDNINGSNIATVTIIVNDVNEPPTAVDDLYGMPTQWSSTGLLVLLNDSDPENDPLTIADVGTPDQGGTAVNLGNVIDYTPVPGFVGTETFSYTVSDGNGGSDVGQVTVNVINDPPTANDDSYGTTEDTGLNVAAPGVLANDTDPYDDPLTTTLVTDVSSGVLSLAPNGSFTYSPNPDFFGTDSFTYTTNDPWIASNVATVTITVDSVNDAPVLGAIGPQAVAEAGILGIGLSATDNDTGDTLSFIALNLPSFCSLTDNNDHTAAIDCDPGYDDAGSYDVTVIVSDNGSPVLDDSEIFTLAVSNTNRAPQAADDSYDTDEDVPMIVASPGVLGNDFDPDGDTLEAILVSDAGSGLLVLNPDGSFTYTPGAEFSGIDMFSYFAGDSQDASPAVFVTITVHAVNDAPVLDPIGPQGVAEGGSTAIGFSATDIDAGDNLSFGATGLPAFCSIVDNGNGTGSLDCSPGYDDAGTYGITVTVSDNGEPSFFDDEVFTLTVTNVNRAPVVSNPGPQVNNEGDTGISLQIVASDADLDTLAYSAAGLPAGLGIDPVSGLITGALDYSTAGAYSVDVTVTDGQDPAAVNFSWDVANTNRAPSVTNPGPQISSEGDSGISLQIVASDADLDTLAYSAAGLPAGLGIDTASGLISGSLDFSTAGSYSVDVTVTDGQDPVAVNFSWNVTDVALMHVDSITTGFYVSKGKTRYTADVLVLDDGGAPLAGVDVTAHWTGSGADSTASTQTTNAGGIATFTTNGIKKPAGVYIFTITGVVKAGYIYDAAGSVTSGQYPPQGPNNPPSATDDNVSTVVDSPLVIDVLANDDDPDADPLTVDSITQPSSGAAVLNGDDTVTYSPGPGYIGNDLFTYTIIDGRGGSDSAVVNITVTDVPQGDFMHIADIAMTTSGRKVKKATAVVTVVDAGGAPVEGVSVSGDWTGAMSGPASGITGSDGTVSLVSPGKKNVSGQTITITITDLAKAGWTYDAAADAGNPASIVFP